MYAMHELARMRQQELLEEAAAYRLAAMAGRRERPTRVPRGGAAWWRREIGWLVIEAGVWLAGGAIDGRADA